MASSFYVFFFCFLFFFIQSQARMPQSFNKASADNAAAVEPTKDSEPAFLPENENQYGLYHRESFAGDNPTGAGDAQKDFSFNRNLPKNYNPVAYVTQPENFVEVKDSTLSGKGIVGDIKNADFSGKGNFEEVKDSTLSGKDLFAVDESDELDDFIPEPKTNNFNDNRYNGGASASVNSRGNYFPSSESRPQGMSDTRSFQNGKYFYDVNAERFSSSHPYETLKASDPAFDLPHFNYRHNYGNDFSGAGEGYQYDQNRGTYGNWP